jgi:hypothetical protein
MELVLFTTKAIKTLPFMKMCGRSHLRQSNHSSYLISAVEVVKCLLVKNCTLVLTKNCTLVLTLEGFLPQIPLMLLTRNTQIIYTELDNAPLTKITKKLELLYCATAF